MTYENILLAINSTTYRESRTLEHPYIVLRAVVELHQPQEITLPDGSWGENCCICNNGWTYPCRTIQVIQEELN